MATPRLLRVYIADDSTVIRDRLAGMLKDLPGVELVGHAADLESFYRDVEGLKPDLLILDLRFPQGSGVDALRWIKVVRPSTRVIVLTNYTSQAVRQICLREGADYFLDKSSEFDKILEIIQFKRSEVK